MGDSEARWLQYTAPFCEIAETALMALPKARIGRTGFAAHNVGIAFDHANAEAVSEAVTSLARQVTAMKPRRYFRVECPPGIEYRYIASDPQRIVRLMRFWDGSHVLTHLDVYFS